MEQENMKIDLNAIFRELIRYKKPNIKNPFVWV